MCTFLEAVLPLGLPVVIENPRLSRLWLHPKLIRSRKKFAGEFLVFDQCGFGARWRKSTGLLAWHFPELASYSRRCSGCKGACSFTGRPHVQLHGKDPSGKWRTAGSQEYPKELCEQVAKAFQQALDDRF